MASCDYCGASLETPKENIQRYLPNSIPDLPWSDKLAPSLTSIKCSCGEHYCSKKCKDNDVQQHQLYCNKQAWKKLKYFCEYLFLNSGTHSVRSNNNPAPLLTLKVLSIFFSGMLQGESWESACKGLSLLHSDAPNPYHSALTFRSDFPDEQVHPFPLIGKESFAFVGSSDLFEESFYNEKEYSGKAKVHALVYHLIEVY